MSSFLQRRSFLVLAAATIFLAGLGAGFWRYQEAGKAMRAALVIKASRSAVAFDPAGLKQLAGSREDLATDAYANIKARLVRLRAVEPTVRFVYIFRYLPEQKQLIFLADSEPPDSPDISLPGDQHPAAPPSPGLQAVISSGSAATEGPITDQFGTWFTGYAPVGEAGPREPRDILGLDIAADHLQSSLWQVAFGTAGYVWLFLVLPLVALVATRREAEQRDALRNLTEAMEQGHSAVVIIDLGRRIEYANAEFCRQFGYSRRELIGREWRELHDSQSHPELVADVVTTLRAGQPWAGEQMMRRKNGSVFPGRGRITPVKDRAGTIRSFVAVFEDMTDVRQTEMALRDARDRAEAGDRAKGQFLATMSHEVRTPLNGIVGFASLLLDTELTPEQQEYVETIRTSSETLIQLTADILDYARIESGRLKLELQPCDPRECVENALDLAAATAAGKNIELLHWIGDDVPAAIMCDVNRLRQVVVNLVNNAVKFTAEGEVEVCVRVLPAPEAATPDAAAPPNSEYGGVPGTAAPAGPDTECFLEFSVRDTGIGIAPEHHEKIFRPFSQADESTTRRFGGSGLGLAICKNIVETMHGKISFESAPGHGSTFTFSIRTRIVESPHAPVPALQGQRLIAVAGHAGLRRELEQLGRRFGAQVLDRAPDDLALTSDWDIAIVDVAGPAAMELAARPEPRPGLPAAKMIAIVPMVLPGELRGALRAHFRLVVNKPLRHEMLANLLRGRAPVSATPSTPEIVPEGYGFNVLIVEDNAVNQRLIQKVISNLGCRWTAAENGRIALDKLAHATPDLVLMDLHMPELDGLSAITKIRAGEAGAAVREVWIIALTADARDDQKARTLAAGADDYLTKPVRLRELTAALDRFKAGRKQ